MKVLELFETQYFDCSVRHFHNALVADHGFTRSYDRLRMKLQSSGLVRPAPRRGAHRRKRPRRPLPGMMLARTLRGTAGFRASSGILS